jgi:NADH dehydrogenase
MKIVIVGAGFAGVRLALNLRNQSNFEIRLISPQTYFEYHAALYRSATGRSPLEVAIPLTDFFKRYQNIEVIEDKIVALDAENKTLTGESESVYKYDAVIFAVGSVTQYFGIKGLEEHSFGVKTINEALELKREIHEDLVDKGQAERNYVVIGAGASGVELSGELIQYLKMIRKRHGIKARYKVDLIEAAPRCLPALPEEFTGKITERLQKLGVRTYFNTAVKSETVNQIKLPNGDIKTHTVVWTAGLANNPIFKKYPKIFNTNKAGKVMVSEYLEAKLNIYVIGDSADTKYSGMAQTAIHNANFIANNLIRLVNGQKRTEYQPKRPVYAIPAGAGWSAVLWGNLKIYGFAGWVLRRLADLKLYLTFLPPSKALTVWKYGFQKQEVCKFCRK